MEENKNIGLTLKLDTSSLTAANITQEQFEAGIEDKVQNILYKEFPETKLKQIIRRESTGIKFACPICHDSAYDPKKKRGHIAFRGKHAGLFTCFNSCGSMPLKKFFKHFGTDLSLTDINFININYQNTENNFQELSNNITANVINRDEAYKYAIDRSYIRDILDLKDIGRETTPIAYKYLLNRCQYSNHERFLYSDKYNQILILNLVGDRVLGIQIRNLTPKPGQAKYLTMTIEKMRVAMLGDKNPVPETISKLSCVFNIFNVDFSRTSFKPIFVAEGPFDSFLLPNCIALSGAGKNFAMQFPFWYIFDKDDTGNEHAIEKMKQGYNVFLWKKFMNDFHIPEINPYIITGNKRKWDITDVNKYFRDIKMNPRIIWSKYFSNNILDAFSI